MPNSSAETIRAACLEAARRAYEDAGIAGICAEGRWELALDAIRSLDLGAAVADARAGVPDDDTGQSLQAPDRS